MTSVGPRRSEAHPTPGLRHARFEPPYPSHDRTPRRWTPPSPYGPPAVPPRLAQALGRELLPARRGGHQRRRGQPDRPAGLAGRRPRRAARHRRRRRQHPPRRHAVPRAGRHQGGHRPLHGHDGHRHQRPGPAGRAGGAGLRDPAHDHDPHGRGGRAVHPPPGADATWSRAASSSWPPAPAARSSPPTPPPPCGARSWGPRSC